MTAYKLKQDYLEKLVVGYEKLEPYCRLDVFGLIDSMAFDFEELYKQHGELYKRSLYEKKGHRNGA